MTRLAFIIPWYGRDIPGGMETLTRHTAERLAAAGWPVEVWTTCIRDFYADWGQNHYRPGPTTIEGVTVRRFAVRRRNKPAFDQLNSQLMQGQLIGPAEQAQFIREMFHCPDLYDHIRQHASSYLLFFSGYMFATTYFGAQICSTRSAVIPCLHDEAYARLALYHPVLRGVRALIYNTAAEQQLAATLLGNDRPPLETVIGLGLDDAPHGAAERFRQQHHLNGPLAVYVGRREQGKNTPLLLDYWRRYVQERQTATQLLLLGPGAVQLPPDMGDHIRDLGFVSAEEKRAAYTAAAVHIQPSIHESFAITLMESWQMGTPVLVHQRCAVTYDHVRRANGGLYFAHYADFAAALDYLLSHPAQAVQIGRQGQAYVRTHYRWPTILEKYAQLIEAMQT